MRQKNFSKKFPKAVWSFKIKQAFQALSSGILVPTAACCSVRTTPSPQQMNSFPQLILPLSTMGFQNQYQEIHSNIHWILLTCFDVLCITHYTHKLSNYYLLWAKWFATVNMPTEPGIHQLKCWITLNFPASKTYTWKRKSKSAQACKWYEYNEHSKTK